MNLNNDTNRHLWLFWIARPLVIPMNRWEAIVSSIVVSTSNVWLSFQIYGSIDEIERISGN